MKWFIICSLFLFTVTIPVQQVQADNTASPNFGPLASLVGEWQGKDRKGNR